MHQALDYSRVHACLLSSDSEISACRRHIVFHGDVRS